MAELQGERHGITLIRIQILFTLTNTVGHLNLNSLLNDTRLEYKSLILDWNEINVFSGGLLAWQKLNITDCVENAADLTIATIGTLNLKVAGLVLPTNVHESLREADVTWLVLVNDQNRALSVSSWDALLVKLIKKLDLEFLIRLPVGIIDDGNLDFTLLLSNAHSHALILLLVVLSGLCGAILGPEPESDVLVNLLLNGDDDVSTGFGHLVSKMLEADRLAVLLRLDLDLRVLASLALIEAKEVFLAGLAHLSAVGDALHSRVWLKAVEQLHYGDILRFHLFVRILGKEESEVLHDVGLLLVGHLLAFGQAWVVALSEFNKRLDAELVLEDAETGLLGLAVLFLASFFLGLTLGVAHVARVGDDAEESHEAEGDAGLPKLDHTWRDDHEHEEEPDVGPGREDGS